MKQIVIPIAGKGTRFLPITKSVCKTLLPIIDKPTLQYLINEAIDAKFEEVIIVMSPEQMDVKDYFSIDTPYVKSLTKDYHEISEIKHLIDKIKISYVVQASPKGLGDAIKCVKPLIKEEAFAVALGDDLIMQEKNIYGINELIVKYNKTKGLYLGVQEVPYADTSKYGIVGGNIKNDIVSVKQIVEKPVSNPPSNLACIGRYLLPYEIFTYLEDEKVGVAGEIQLTDAIEQYLKDHSHDVYAVKIKNKRFDIGSKQGYVKANIEYSMNREDLKKEINEYLKEIVNG